VEIFIKQTQLMPSIDLDWNTNIELWFECCGVQPAFSKCLSLCLCWQGWLKTFYVRCDCWHLQVQYQIEQGERLRQAISVETRSDTFLTGKEWGIKIHSLGLLCMSLQFSF